MKNRIVVIAIYLIAIGAQAQTNLSAVPNLFGTNNYLDRAALYLGAPPESQLDIGAGVSYVQSFKSGQKYGWWLAGTYSTATNSIMAYEFGTQYLQTTPGQGMSFAPNGLLLFRKAFNVSAITIAPLLELGGAVDDKFSHPYGITGAGLDIGWHGISVLGGAERWLGPYNSFTVVKVGVAYSFTF